MSSEKVRSVEKLITAHRQREGGGFMVRRPLPTHDFALADPFLLLDEMGPMEVAAGEAKGAPDHPHRGFETVTYLLEGEMMHEDSAGNRGTLSAGDVQWMTAGAGVVHSEMPSARFQRQGGRMHGFQLWVNLPAAEKMIPPRYQEIPGAGLPVGKSEDGLAQVRVLAGEALGARAVIQTHTPIAYHDWTLRPGARVDVPLPESFAAYVYVFEGAALVGGKPVGEGQLAVLGSGSVVGLEVSEAHPGPARLLLLGGVPLEEPVSRYGPFVMNTREQIVQAVNDYEAGRLGQISRSSDM